jgi:pimeloyl-ACP methyl ester carboxylesterase
MRNPLRRKGLFVLAGGLAVLLGGPFLIPVPPLKDTFPPKALADDDSQFVEINGLEIHFKKVGQGAPVFLLLHGFAASLYSWHAVIDQLSQFGTVIAFDRPGFGLSEHPITWQGQNPYSSEAQVELVLKLLDHFGVQQAILVGNSAGGTISLQVALEHPERVSALILVDPAIYNSGGVPQWVKPILGTPQMRHLGPLISRQILKRGRDLIKFAWHNPALLPKDMLENYQKPFQVENWDRALWEFTLASQAKGLNDRLDELNLPVLVITGDDDRIVPTKHSIRLAREIPNASLVVIDDAGHLPHEEQPQMFMEAVTSYLKKIQLQEKNDAKSLA